MDPQTQAQMQQEIAEIHVIVKENYRVTREIRRHQLFEMYGKWVFFLLVIVSGVYFVVTYLQPLAAKYSATTGSAPSGLFGLPTSADLQKLINSYKAGQ